VAEREAGVASVSAPVLGPGGEVVAAISVSGPIERLGRSPGRLHAAAVVAAAHELS
jgi:DNA-binding IclR family transcriptional regulator